MKWMKVYDIYEMPIDVKNYTSKHFEDSNQDGDYKTHYVEGWEGYKKKEKYNGNIIYGSHSNGEWIAEQGDDIIRDWLIANGCTMDEEILIKF